MSKISSILDKLQNAISSTLSRVLYKLGVSKWILLGVLIIDLVIVYYLAILLPFPINAILGVFVVFSSLMFLVFLGAVKRIGVIPVSEDLIYILVHMRCMITGNPPLTTMFGRVGETRFYRKKYRNLFRKLSELIKNWGYSAPEALKLVAREAGSKVDETFLQRLSAIVATGANVEEYLRIEYNTLIAEYSSAFNRLINALRVVLGVYTTLLGALTFMVATLMLLGMIFGEITQLILTGIISEGFTLLGMAILLFVFTRRPLFESKPRRKIRLLLLIELTGLMGFVIFVLLLVYLVVSGDIYRIENTAVTLIIAGLGFLPSGILVKILENRINEYDMFFPAFIRSYGEHLSVLPNMVEALKPLLVAELGKLKKPLSKTYARLVNRVDPRIAWELFADELNSEMVARGMYIFIDTTELGGNMATAGALISDHTNELFRLRTSYIQIFKTFEVTLYFMHLTALIILLFISSFINTFSNIISSFLRDISSEYIRMIGFLMISPLDVSLVTNISSIVMMISNIIALYAVNPGSKYGIFYYLSILLIITGLGIYIGSYIMTGLINTILQPIG